LYIHVATRLIKAVEQCRITDAPWKRPLTIITLFLKLSVFVWLAKYVKAPTLAACEDVHLCIDGACRGGGLRFNYRDRQAGRKA